ncbi:iron-sulfur cluster repair di-iron protein [bacterium]|nr:iron-sulfur cluster repair di-iron protein [bacterium]
MHQTLIDPTWTVGRIAAEYPETVNVFLNHNLDFCCGGNRALHNACVEANLTTEELTGELQAAIDGDSDTEEINWTTRSTDELISHIVDKYHKPLREVLPQLMILAQRVEEAHGPTHGPSLTQLRESVQALRADLLRHLDDEEQRLFPLILEGRSAEVPETVEQLVRDHNDVALVLNQIRELTSDFQLPDDACNTWRAFWWNLETLEKELKKHIHLENNVLFPSALAKERRAS